MVVYHFYLNDGSEEPPLIAILPERRKNPQRITRESIMRWARLAAGSHIDPDKVHFVEVRIDDET